MKKWLYLVFGILLVGNMIAAIIYTPFPVYIFQALWGIPGIILLRKATKLFQNNKEKQNG